MSSVWACVSPEVIASARVLVASISPAAMMTPTGSHAAPPTSASHVIRRPSRVAVLSIRESLSNRILCVHASPDSASNGKDAR